MQPIPTNLQNDFLNTARKERKRVEVVRRNATGIDKADDVHGLRGLDIGLAEVFVVQQHVLVLGVLVDRMY